MVVDENTKHQTLAQGTAVYHLQELRALWRDRIPAKERWPVDQALEESAAATLQTLAMGAGQVAEVLHITEDGAGDRCRAEKWHRQGPTWLAQHPVRCAGVGVSAVSEMGHQEEMQGERRQSTSSWPLRWGAGAEQGVKSSLWSNRRHEAQVEAAAGDRGAQQAEQQQPGEEMVVYLDGAPHNIVLEGVVGRKDKRSGCLCPP
ncbi:unnamed protein product [Lampetra planeri]